MKIKGKHLLFTILIMLDFMGIFWIKKEPDFLGVVSVTSMFVTFGFVISYLLNNYNSTLFKL